MKYPSDGSPLVPTNDIPLVVDGSDMPAVDNDALNQLLPASRRDGTGRMFQAVLTTARTALNFVWSRVGRKLNAQRTPRYAGGVDLAAWGRHLKRPALPDEGEGQYRDRLCAPLDTITPDALKAPVARLVGELTNIPPLFLEPAVDGAFAAPLTFAPGAPTWSAFCQPAGRRLWAQDDSRPGAKYGAYVVPDANHPMFWFLVPDVGDDSLAPHSMPLTTSQDTAQDYVNSAAPTWGVKSPMAAASLYHAVVALRDGRVLVCGGQLSSASAPVVSSAIYDPVADAWTAAAPMNHARSRHIVVMLDSGVALAVGGSDAANGSTSLASCEIYDPIANTWSTLPGALVAGRHTFTIVRLLTGKFLAMGGRATGNAVVPTCELLDPLAGTWTSTGSLSLARDRPPAAVLRSGRVLVAGNGIPTTACEIYNPVAGTWSAPAALNTARYRPGMALLPNGRVLALGGEDAFGGPMASCELYDEAENTWTSVPSMANARYGAAVFQAIGGQVIAVGGYGPAAGAVDRFDPNTNTWATQAVMSETKGELVGVMTRGDEPLIFGGDKLGTFVATVERLAPALTSYGFVPTRTSNLMDRIISEIEPRRSTGYPWMLIGEPLLGSDV